MLSPRILFVLFAVLKRKCVVACPYNAHGASPTIGRKDQDTKTFILAGGREVFHENTALQFHLRGGAQGSEIIVSETAGSPLAIKRNKPPSIIHTSNRVHHHVQRTTQSWLRRQFWALLAMRFVFVLLFPIGLMLLAGFFIVGTIVHATFLLTLTLWGSQTRMIFTALTKAALAVVVASLTGVMLPVFASFGLVISILQCGVELTEPILRIRYQRQLRKIRHLHTLLTDPVLVETLQHLLRGAEAVTAMTQRQLSTSAKASRRKLGQFASNAAALPSSLISTEMVEQLITEVVASGTASQEWLATVQSKAPPAVWKWAQEQYDSLKKSGLLEAAAQQALQALQSELQAASEFLPYLNAIEQVRRQQLECFAKAAAEQKKAQRKSIKSE